MLGLKVTDNKKFLRTYLFKMAPSPQETVVQHHETAKNTSETPSKPLAGEEVVISGLSGIFPKSDSVKEFMENLYNKVLYLSSYLSFQPLFLH